MENIKKTFADYPFLTRPLTIYERENGHKIVFGYKPGGLVNVSTWVKTGSINENDKNNGVSHFLEHLMFKGTHENKAGYFDRTLERKGAIVNAATWKDYTFYYVTIPKGINNENFYETLHLHADMMLDPVIPPDEIGEPFDINGEPPAQKRERHVVIEEIGMRKDQPWTKVYNYLNFNMYTNHPYKRDVIGTEEIISQIKREEVLDYYTTHYTPNAMTTIIVGDIEPDEVIEKVCEEFDFKGRENYTPPKNEADKHIGGQKDIEMTAHTETAFIMYGWLGAPADDIKTVMAFDIISIILGEGQSSRLYQNLVEKIKEPVFISIDTSAYSFKDGGNFFIQAGFYPDKKPEVKMLIENELQKLINDGFSNDEFKKAVKKLKVRFAQEAETVSEIAENIGYYSTVCSDVSKINEYVETLKTITKNDVADVINKYLTIDLSTVAILMPEE